MNSNNFDYVLGEKIKKGFSKGIEQINPLEIENPISKFMNEIVRNIYEEKKESEK